MFRALAQLQGEKRPSSEGFATQHSEFVVRQEKVFTEQLPNLFPTTMSSQNTNSAGNVLANAKYGIATWDPNTRQPSLRDIDISKYATSIQANENLIARNNVCKTTSIDNLINTQDPANKIRCGWIYKKGTPGDKPSVSEGALGTRKGPLGFLDNQSGTWYWNLEDAKKAILGDRCEALTRCESVGADNYANCAFSKTRGIGVPVDQAGNLLYPNDPKLSAPSSSLVRNSGQCPPPPAVGSPAYELQRSRDVCTPIDSSGRLSRDCLLQQITAAGCKQDGSLYRQLVSSAQPTNYAAGLQNTLAFKKYQENAKMPILDSIIRDGRTTTSIALANFNEIAKVTHVPSNTVLNYAARDLCLKSGTIDQFDFCSDLRDTSPAPFALECLQNEFRRAGGQPAGSQYPSEANKQMWDSLGRWGKVKERIDSLLAGTRSENEGVQRNALSAFLGIQRQPYSVQQIAPIPGTEVLWFNRGNNTFLGRRINVSEFSGFPAFSTGGDVEGTGRFDFVEYYVLTNLRPNKDENVRLRLESDDGILYTLNKSANGATTRNQFFDTSDSFGANWDQPPTRYDAKQCWNLKANGPNYVMGFWQETGGYAHSQVYYAPCNTSSFSRLPSSWFTLVQEPDAPMFSWEGNKRDNASPSFNERRMPTVMSIQVSPKAGAVDLQNMIPNINAGLKLKYDGNGFAQTSKNIGFLSWRTITLAFVPSSNTQVNATLLQYGPLTLTIERGNLVLKWVGGLTLTYAMPISVFDGKTPHYFVLNIRSDLNNQYPNRITFQFGAVSDWKSGRISFGQGGNSGSTASTVNNIPVASPTGGEKLVLGDLQGNNSADATVAFLRMFDYELDNKDILRDINNSWLMRFFDI